MMDIIDKIKQLSSKLSTFLPMKPEFQAKLDKKFRLEFNYNSNHIEGNTLTYGETELLLFFNDTKGNHSKREYDEMEAHDVAFKLIKEWANETERPINETSIKNLNEVILVKPFYKDAITPNGEKTRRLIKVGDYKEYPNSVQLSNGEIFEYATVSDTPILMGELMEWYRNEEFKNEFHPVALAALFHYKLVRIHPFDDGNGRISRLMMNYVLLKNNLPPVVIKSSDKRNYLYALNKADTGDLNSFITYIAEQLIWSLELSIKAANGESIEEVDDVEKEISIWKKQVTEGKTSGIKRSDELVYNLFKNSISEIFEEFEDKHKQFYDLFHETIYHTYKKDKGISNGSEGIQWLASEFDQTLLNTRTPVLNLKDSFRDLLIDIQLKGYKYNKKNSFTINSKLLFRFNPYNTYNVYYVDKKIEKNYNDLLTKEERIQIISDSIKYVFEEIKKKSNEK